MNCWKCGKEISDGSLFCSFCGADQSKAPKLDTPGAVMQHVFLQKGAEAVLKDADLLPDALLETLPEEKITALRLRMALKEGIGQYYLDQIPQGRPGSDFMTKVHQALTERVGLGDKPALNLMAYLGEMLGWNTHTDQTAEKKPEAPAPTPVRAAAPAPAPVRTPAPQAKPAAPVRPAAPAQNPPPQTKAQEAEPQQNKRTWKDFLFLPFAALFVYFGVDNTNKMNGGQLYTTYFDIPAQYLYYTLAALLLIWGIVALVKKKDQ